MTRQYFNRLPYFQQILRRPPSASARMRGGAAYPELSGLVRFYQTKYGVLVSAQIFGLPTADSACEPDIFAFHIHSGAVCTGDAEDPFADALGHYDPGLCRHPAHAGDLPPLWGDRGYALSQFLTDRFSVEDVIGRAVMVHRNPDDFTTQPSGNAGERIACGIIERNHLLQRE